MADLDPNSAAGPAGTTAPARRRFLKQSATLAAGAALYRSGSASAAGPATAEFGQSLAIPRRPLGSTGLEVSAIGLGGYSLGDAPNFQEAQKIVNEAIDAGVNFFDNAWEYHDGQSEQWLGDALGGQRDKVILMTKVCTHGRDKQVAMKQLEQSLKRLRTDHVDLWQVHECIYYNDPEWAFARDGVIAALDEAKKSGKVRFVGFTGHKHPDIHLKMLSHDYPFDSVQMPLNCFDATYRSFEKSVLPEVNRRKMAALGMKSLCGGGKVVWDMPVSVEEALRYAMSLPVSVTISGVDSLEVLHQNLAIARGFTPLSAEQMQALRSRAAAAAGDGHLELYKSTKKFDGAVGRETHGYPPQQLLPL